jgi:arylsulfatase A-like enzyme
MFLASRLASPTPTAARGGDMRRSLAVVLGSLCAGAAFSGCEVAWLAMQPQLPVEALRAPSFQPPRELRAMFGVALATYLPLAALLAPAGILVARRLRPRTPGRAFAVGCAASGVALAGLAALVWVNLLLDRPPLQARSLATAAGVAGALGLAVAAGSWLVGRVSRGAVLPALLVGALLPALLFGVAAAAYRASERPLRVARGQAAPGAPNVVFVTIDTLRADHVGIYGGAARTPNFDRVAAEGVRFARSISQVPNTTPSHVSMFTSLYPFAHGAKNGVPIRAGFETLPDQFRRLGYHTAAFVSAYTTVSQVTGLADAFDVYVDSLSPHLAFLGEDEVEPLVFHRLLSKSTGNQLDGSVVNQRVFRWLDEEPGQPFFLWVHYFDAHGPYEPRTPYTDLYLKPGDDEVARDVALYNAQITHADDHLGKLLARLGAAGVLENSILVLTSDHGQSFKEPHPRPEYGHGDSLYDPALWVPLAIHAPGRLPSGAVVEQQVESIDLAPTLLELVGAPVPQNFVGRSLVALARGTGRFDPELAFSQTANHRKPHFFSVRSPDWKLHVSPDGAIEELFDLAADPGETRNLVSELPHKAQEYRELLQSRMNLSETDHDLDHETLERLRAMGYVE